MSNSPQVTINPAMCSGEPCVDGHRIPVDYDHIPDPPGRNQP